MTIFRKGKLQGPEVRAPVCTGPAGRARGRAEGVSEWQVIGRRRQRASGGRHGANTGPGGTWLSPWVGSRWENLTRWVTQCDLGLKGYLGGIQTKGQPG